MCLMLSPTAYCQLHLKEHVVVADIHIKACWRSVSIFTRISHFSFIYLQATLVKILRFDCPMHNLTNGSFHYGSFFTNLPRISQCHEFS